MNIVKINEESFQILLETSKRMKSDITMLDGGGGIHGCNGFVNEEDKIFDIGCIKRVIDEYSKVSRIKEMPVINIAIQSKNIIALGKIPGDGLELYYQKYSDDVYMCDSVKRGDLSYIAFDCQKLYMCVMNGFYANSFMTIKKTLIDNLDISDYQPFLDVINMSASEGGAIVNYNGIPIFTIGNILGVNKGDKVFLTVEQITDRHANALFTVCKTKKNYRLEVKSTILI
jgi:hypothetical protein|nr:MAG TPA: hypothetical protein [Caudoviricetes sp.]